MTKKSRIVPNQQKGRLVKLCGLALVWAIAAQAPSAAQDSVVLKIRNDLESEEGGFSATVEVKSLRSLTPNQPWRTVNIPPGRFKTLEIASPDDYVVRATAAGVTYQSEAMSLKAWIRDNKNYELTLIELFSGSDPRIQLGLMLQDPSGSDDGSTSKEIKFTRVGGSQPRRRFRR